MCPCIGNNHPIWPIFSEGLKPPTSMVSWNEGQPLDLHPDHGSGLNRSWYDQDQGGIEPIEPIHKKGIGGFCGNHPQMSELFRLVIYFKLQLDMIGGVTPTIRSGASFMGVVQWKHRLEIWGCHGWNQMLHAGVSAKNVTWVLHFNMGKASKYWMI